MKKFTVYVFLLALLLLIFYGIAFVLNNFFAVPVPVNLPGINVERYKNFIVAGVDEGGYRTDLIMFCQYDYNEKKLTALQIPRDTKVDNNRSDKKINSAYGSKDKEAALFSELHSIIDIKADKYIIVNFKGFRDIIDEIGGVDVNVPIRMYYTDPVQKLVIDLKKGEQHLDGKKAEMFMRFRMNNNGSGYPEGDVGRIKAQKEFYNAVINKAFDAQNIMKAPNILNILQENTKTNLSGDELLKLISSALTMDRENIKIIQLPGIAQTVKGVSYYIHNEKETKLLIEENFIQ